jgi:hypothetical protein
MSQYISSQNIKKKFWDLCPSCKPVYPSERNYAFNTKLAGLKGLGLKNKYGMHSAGSRKYSGAHRHCRRWHGGRDVNVLDDGKEHEAVDDEGERPEQIVRVADAIAERTRIHEQR